MSKKSGFSLFNFKRAKTEDITPKKHFTRSSKKKLFSNKNIAEAVSDSELHLSRSRLPLTNSSPNIHNSDSDSDSSTYATPLLIRASVSKTNREYYRITPRELQYSPEPEESGARSLNFQYDFSHSTPNNFANITAVNKELDHTFDRDSLNASLELQSYLHTIKSIKKSKSFSKQTENQNSSPFLNNKGEFDDLISDPITQNFLSKIANSSENNTSPSGSNMSTFDLTKFHKLVPQFDGNEDDLDRFIDTCGDRYTACTEDIGKAEFMSALRSKLTGRAYDFFKKTVYTDWPTLKTDLKKQFASPETFEGYHLKLTSLKQENLSVRQYADKIEKILFAMNKASSEIKVNNRDGTDFFKAQNDKLAIKSFINGLKDSLRNVLRARKYTTIRDAISDAVELEIEDASRKHNAFISEPTSSNITKIEKSANNNNNNGNNAMNKYIQARNNSINSNQNNSNRTLICNRCGKMNHTSNMCRARFPMNQFPNNSNNNFRQNPNQYKNYRNYNRNNYSNQNQYQNYSQNVNRNQTNNNNSNFNTNRQPNIQNSNSFSSNQNNFRHSYPARFGGIPQNSNSNQTNSNGIQVLAEAKNDQPQSHQTDGMALEFLIE